MNSISEDKLEKLIDAWSAYFHPKIQQFFSLEELKQELWVCLLEVSKRLSSNKIEGITPEKYMFECATNHISKELVKEAKNKILILDDPDSALQILPSQENEVITKDLICKISKKICSTNIGKHKNSPYELENIIPIISSLLEQKTLQEVADEFGLSRERIRMIRKIIRKHYKNYTRKGKINVR